ncbi:hypothetical protein D3C72_1976210 [compost metagenome]
MLCHALTNDTSIAGVHRREQGRHTMTVVVVSHRLTSTSRQRQAWLGPVNRLNLALLVATATQQRPDNATHWTTRRRRQIGPIMPAIHIRNLPWTYY